MTHFRPFSLSNFHLTVTFPTTAKFNPFTMYPTLRHDLIVVKILFVWCHTEGGVGVHTNKVRVSVKFVSDRLHLARLRGH